MVQWFAVFDVGKGHGDLLSSFSALVVLQEMLASLGLNLEEALVMPRMVDSRDERVVID